MLTYTWQAAGAREIQVFIMTSATSNDFLSFIQHTFAEWLVYINSQISNHVPRARGWGDGKQLSMGTGLPLGGEEIFWH